MTSIRRLLALGLLAAALPVAGEEGVRPVPPFRHERAVLPGAPGPNRLDVDVSLLAGSEARSGSGLLSDLRPHDAAGREVPELLVPPRRAEPEWLSATLLPIAATKTASGFEADLGALRRVDRLRVSGIPAPFLKRLRLEGSGDRARWTLLAEEGTLFDLPEEGLARTVVAFPAGEHRFLRLVWNDAKSGRVPLPSRVEARAAGTGGAPEALRAEVPFDRDGVGRVERLRHVGVYAYRRAFLERYLRMEPTPAERAEQLEQLRVLEHGHGIAVGLCRTRQTGIDTPEQYAAFVERWRSRRAGGG